MNDDEEGGFVFAFVQFLKELPCEGRLPCPDPADDNRKPLFVSTRISV
jgi:hypothetical protein